MNKNKCLYEAPNTNILVVRVEGTILQTSGVFRVNGFTDDDDDALSAQ